MSLTKSDQLLRSVSPPAGDKSVPIRRMCNIIKPYFSGPQRRGAIFSLVVTLALLLAYIFINVQVSYALKKYTDTVHDRHSEDTYLYLGYWALWLCLMVPMFVNFGFYRSMQALKFRRFMTPFVIALALAKNTLHRMNGEPAIDNLEWRITQNVKDFSLQAAGLFFSLVESLTNFVFFTPALWQISPFLTAFAFVYPAVGSGIAILLARKLVPLAAKQDMIEANFRLDVGLVRKHILSIALLRAEVHEREVLGEKFDLVTANFEQIVRINRRLAYFTTFYNYMVALIPFGLLAHNYFNGELTWGDLAQASFVFAQMYNSAALLVSQFGNFSDFASTTNRLGSFLEALYRHHNEVPAGSGIQIIDADHFALDQLTVLKPDTGAKMTNEPLSFVVENGSSLAISSADGSGALLLRVIAGIERGGDGCVHLPSRPAVMFLAQPPYVPQGTLRQALAYPGDGQQLTDVRVRRWLKLLKLEEVEATYGLDEENNWEEKVSLIDRQRIGLARLLMAKPKYVFLDEPTVGLESEAEHIFSLLEGLDATIVTVTQQPDIARRHDQVLELVGDGSWKLTSAVERLLTTVQLP